QSEPRAPTSKPLRCKSALVVKSPLTPKRSAKDKNRSRLAPIPEDRPEPPLPTSLSSLLQPRPETALPEPWTATPRTLGTAFPDPNFHMSPTWMRTPFHVDYPAPGLFSG